MKEAGTFVGDLGAKKAKHSSQNPFGMVYHPKERRTGRRLANEKRHVRIEFHDEKLHVEGFAAAVTDLTTDLSGMGLIVDRRLDKGTRLKIYFEDHKTQGILVAEVVWSNELPITGHIIKSSNSEWRWRVGLKVISDLTNETEKNLILQLRGSI